MSITMDRYKLCRDVGMLMIKIYQTTQITEALQGVRLRRDTENTNRMIVRGDLTFVSLLVKFAVSLLLSGLQKTSLRIIRVW
mgnify:CR=1 FL=1